MLAAAAHATAQERVTNLTRNSGLSGGGQSKAFPTERPEAGSSILGHEEDTLEASEIAFSHKADIFDAAAIALDLGKCILGLEAITFGLEDDVRGHESVGF